MLHKITNIMSTLENINQYEITPTHLDRIADLVEKKRFKNQDHFIDRAIEVFLAWETNPPKAMEEMMKIEPTIAQYSHMITMGMEYAQLKIMYPRHPEKFGQEWIDHLLDDKTGLEERFEKSKCIHDPQSDARASHKDYEHAIANKTDAGNFLNTQNFLKPIENSTEYVYDQWPLLFTHHSRLFPAKVAALSLAELMRNNNNMQINFEKFTQDAFDLCEEISEKQINREIKKNISREHRLSTGLPKPFKKDITDNKQTEYQNRYKEKYFGKLKRNRKDGKQYFEGLMSSLDLVKFFKIDGESFVTFTKKGKDFILLENPIFEGEYEHKPFSDDEVKYILKNLISERHLEVNLMAGALRLIESKIGIDEDIVHQLDEAFQIIIQEYCDSNKEDRNFDKLNEILVSTKKITMDIKTAEKELKTDLDKEDRENSERRSKKQTPIQAIRIATMGRMSELNLVTWGIDGGKSSFTLGTPELVEIIKKQVK